MGRSPKLATRVPSEKNRQCSFGLAKTSEFDQSPGGVPPDRHGGRVVVRHWNEASNAAPLDGGSSQMMAGRPAKAGRRHGSIDQRRKT